MALQLPVKHATPKYSHCSDRVIAPVYTDHHIPTVQLSFHLWQAAEAVQQHEGGRQKQLPDRNSIHEQGAQRWSKASSLLHVKHAALRMHAA
jgi:hypothetical protein